jgi:hypothetical protein
MANLIRIETFKDTRLPFRAIVRLPRSWGGFRGVSGGMTETGPWIGADGRTALEATRKLERNLGSVCLQAIAAGLIDGVPA